MRGYRLSRKAQAEKTFQNTRLQEDVGTKQIEKKANARGSYYALLIIFYL